MPVQVIINAVNPEEALSQMASFLGLRRLDQPLTEPQAETQMQGNGGDAGAGTHGSTETITAEPKRRGRKPKEPEPERQTAAGIAAQDDADEAQGAADTAT